MNNVNWSLVTVTAPTIEPITLTETKLHIRVDHDTEDSLIETLISAARNILEQNTSRGLAPATYKLTMDRFPSLIELPRSPATSVTHIKYYDQDGVQQTWSSSEYRVDLNTVPARITPEYDYVYPTPREVIAAIEIQYAAGYTASNIPAALKQAMLILVGHLYENRQIVNSGMGNFIMPKTVDYLISPYRVTWYK